MMTKTTKRYHCDNTYSDVYAHEKYNIVEPDISCMYQIQAIYKIYKNML